MITSIDNSRIKETRKLQRRRSREQMGAFLIEGVRLVSDAWQSKARFREVYFSAERITDNSSAQALLVQLAVAQIDCIACSAAVLATLTETITPQGIVAVVRTPQLPLPATMNFVLIFDQVRNPGNAGTLLRAAEAAGVDLVIFGPATVDPFNDKVVRAAMGAHFRLPLRICADWTAIGGLLPPGLSLYLAQANAERTYDAVDWCQATALVVGGEASGASNAAYGLARSIAIPMHGQVESLNAAMAGVVILFEAARQRRQIG